MDSKQSQEQLAKVLCTYRRERKASDHMYDWMHQQGEVRPCIQCIMDAKAIAVSAVPEGEAVVKWGTDYYTILPGKCVVAEGFGGPPIMMFMDDETADYVVECLNEFERRRSARSEGEASPERGRSMSAQALEQIISLYINRGPHNSDASILVSIIGIARAALAQEGESK